MNIDDAKEWLKRMETDDIAKIIYEHHHLKQHLCAKVLHVPTGCDDWVSRSIERAMNL